MTHWRERKRKPATKQLGSVIVWKKEASKTKIIETLADAREKGLIESIHTEEFDPELGGPVFYIP